MNNLGGTRAPGWHGWCVSWFPAERGLRAELVGMFLICVRMPIPPLEQEIQQHNITSRIKCRLTCMWCHVFPPSSYQMCHFSFPKCTRSSVGFFLTGLEELSWECSGEGERLPGGCIREMHLEEGQCIPSGAVSQAEGR